MFRACSRGKTGRTLFVSSEASQVVPKDMIRHATSKTAQLTISRGFADMTRGTAVAVNAVMPATTRSPGVGTYRRGVAADPEAPLEGIEREVYRSDRPLSLTRRLIEAEEIAALVAFPASPLPGAANGAALRADGGVIPAIA